MAEYHRHPETGEIWEVDDETAAAIRALNSGVNYPPGSLNMVNPATVAKGDLIRIVPEAGPERLMVVAHVEHHIITLSDFDGEEG